ncbi:MAG: cob(I)yrinic acid a,c-diamide adenosyltransferase [Candidatus Thermoplasmatota archaeon]|nr:cob(I)yrinic acid a,c-diamide adenosyltransferase [Candidatus Thermoplasmatota archaeon]
MAPKLKKGLVEVYTGNGKGKTTASFGLAFRALGWGLRVYIIQFMKLGTYGENRTSSRFPDDLRVDFAGMPYFIAWEDDIPKADRDRIKNVVICKRNEPPQEYREKVQKAFSSMLQEVSTGKWDIVIMDEVNVAIYYHLLDLEQVLRFIDGKSDNLEIVLTGRKMPDEILQRASLITEMLEIKHPYSQGIPARRGIDY